MSGIISFVCTEICRFLEANLSLRSLYWSMMFDRSSFETIPKSSKTAVAMAAPALLVDPYRSQIFANFGKLFLICFPAAVECDVMSLFDKSASWWSLSSDKSGLPIRVV
jgi:hypothetical protein